MAIHTITILVNTIANQIHSVSRRTQDLCYADGDEVVWALKVTPHGAPPPHFKVIFPGPCPFTTSVFDNTNNQSGPIAVPPGEKDQYFPYRVEVEKCDPIDPGIIVW